MALAENPVHSNFCWHGANSSTAAARPGIGQCNTLFSPGQQRQGTLVAHLLEPLMADTVQQRSNP